MQHSKALFIKPDKSDKPLYRNKIDHDVISFRSLIPDEDIDFLFNWTHLPYSKRFWQQDVSKSNLLALFNETIAHPYTHSFIGSINEQPVCQVELYNIHTDELKEHLNYGMHDCGLHLLMLPPKQLKKGWTILMLTQFLHFYFSYPEAEHLYIEPDQENSLANQLAKRAHFHFHKTVKLSYKTANLYSISKQQFHATNK
jgi:RimJ/RimL family protein N-acetyltransferase